MSAALLAAPVALAISISVAIVIKLSSRGPVLYWSDRIGRDERLFSMPKFRTMRVDTPAIATHLLMDADSLLIWPGRFLRRSSVDELPQLWSVLRGDMSLVGPRPALFNQYDLIAQRRSAGVDRVKPGITGWAQINGRDELSIPDKVAADAEYVESRSFLLDLRILFATLSQVLHGRGISH